MELEGSLKAFGLPEVLQFLAMGKMTGTLTVNKGNKSISLMISVGKIINSSSIDRPRKLGEMLVNRGVLKRKDLEAVLSRQRASTNDRLLGQFLIDEGLVAKDLLVETIRLQIEEEIWELFGWEEGHFKFEHGKPEIKSDIVVEIDIEPFLIEGSRRLDEWAKIVKNIGNDNILLGIEPLEEDGEIDKEITLSDDEWTVLSLINGFYNVGSIVNRSGLSKFETYRILNYFLASGLIFIKNPEEVEIEEKERQAEVAPSKEQTETEAVSKPLALKKVGSFLSFKKGTYKEKILSGIDLVSPVSAIAFFLNELLKRLVEDRRFFTEPEDKNLLHRLWLEIVMNYSKSDLIKVRNNHIDTSEFDGFSQLTEMGEVMTGCYEDSLAALSQLLKIVHKVAGLRLGARNVNYLIESTVNEVAPRLNLTYWVDFNFGEFVYKALSISS